nr:hypothetical protein CFP56_42634 [Quercus suber]
MQTKLKLYKKKKKKMNRTYNIYIYICKTVVLEYFCPSVLQGFQLTIVVAFFYLLGQNGTTGFRISFT